MLSQFKRIFYLQTLGFLIISTIVAHLLKFNYPEGLSFNLNSILGYICIFGFIISIYFISNIRFVFKKHVILKEELINEAEGRKSIKSGSRLHF